MSGGMDPRSLRLDPMGTRYEAVTRLGYIKDRRPREDREKPAAARYVDRDPCFKCGARADAGCKHRPAVAEAADWAVDEPTMPKSAGGMRHSARRVKW